MANWTARARSGSSGERTKNGLRYAVPLSPGALSIFIGERSFKREASVTSVLAGGYRAERLQPGAPPVGCRFPVSAARELPRRPSLPPWVVHDIRRSVASGIARFGTPLHVIERCLNHVSGNFGGSSAFISGTRQRVMCAASRCGVNTSRPRARRARVGELREQRRPKAVDSIPRRRRDVVKGSGAVVLTLMKIGI